MKIVDIDRFTVMAYEFLEEGMIRSEQHNTAWELLEAVLAECYDIRISDKRVLENEHGKPYFEDCCVSFNITHTNGLAACIICANSEVGIDAEGIRAARQKVIRKFMTETEKAHFERLSEAERPEYFFRIWTLKEAHSKVMGTGIGKDFSKPEFVPSDRPVCTDNRFWYYQWKVRNKEQDFIISAALEK